MKKEKHKNDINYISARITEVNKLYDILVNEYAIATIEKKLTVDSSEVFRKRWDKIALNWNHWHQVSNITRKKLKNPAKIEYLVLRKIYNKLKNTD
jgi:hypothetical protein